MSTDNQLIDALQKAAEKLLKRSITATERNRLIELFNQSTATSTFGRAKEAIARLGDLSESQIIEKVAAADDTDRTIQDLKEIADQWKR